ncbi:MFS transporter [Candidatus Parcubacteria bacterium]|nr:MFS transporter [Candidatus Parcubacteria bacterium]
MQKRILPVIFGTLLLDMIGIGMIIPIIPIIFTDPASSHFILQGYSQSAQFLIAGLVTALFGLMQFIAAPLLGELSDVYGRKRLLITGVAVLALSQLLFGFGVETASLALLIVSRIVAGIAGANFSIAQATIADVTEPKDRAKNFGLTGAAFGIGFILGPLLGGLIAGYFHSASAPFWFAGALGILNVLFLYFFLPETRRTPAAEKRSFHILKGIQNIKAAFDDHDARPVYLSSFLYMAGFAFFTSFISILLVNRFGFDEKGVGTFFAVTGFWIVFTQLVILRILSGKFAERKILKVSIFSVAAMLALYPFMPEALYLFVLMPFFAIPQGLTMANMSALVSKSVSADRQGAALGINGSLMALAQGVIPVAAGLGGGFLGLNAPFLAGSALIFLSWGILFVFMRRN